MTFTNLEKYVYSKNDVNLPHPSLQEQPSEEGKLQIFFLTAKIISFLIRNNSVR